MVSSILAVDRVEGECHACTPHVWHATVAVIYRHLPTYHPGRGLIPVLLTRCCLGVFVCDEFVTVTKASDAEWEEISTQLLQVSYLSRSREADLMACDFTHPG
jgi:hypothetical protein